MDFKDAIRQLSERIEKVKGNLQTEEATKTALVMPFLQILGYDVFDPMEVMPEFNCDIGTKKGEKIDYAIFRDGDPVILIECKHWQQDLNLHDNQLLRYFHVSNAKFGILTNGIIYRFYTDLENPNKMDEKPFLEINLSDFKSVNIEELKKFHKTNFDLNNILSSANELKYTGEIKNILSKEFINPSGEFVKFFVRQLYDGVVTAKVLQQFTPLVRLSIANYINDAISDRLQSALKNEKSELQAGDNTEIAITDLTDEIVTTEEELEGFYIVKSILRAKIPAESIIYKDAKTYFTIFTDNSPKSICRLYLNSPTTKQISFVGDDKKEVRHKIQSLDDIYLYADHILKVVDSL